MFKSKKILFISGISLSTVLAPLYFTFSYFSFSIFLRSIMLSTSLRDSFYKGFVFGLGFFIASFYWLMIAIKDLNFIYYFPVLIAIFIMFAILSIFTGFISAIIFKFKFLKSYLHILFIILWVCLEFLFEHIIQFPWSLVGYGVGFSLILSQSASLWGVLGISCIMTYIGSIFYECKINHSFISKIVTASILILVLIIFGNLRIKNNRTEFLENNVRLVQPSVKQSEKWSIKYFYKNMDLLNHLSKQSLPKDNDLIIWPESAIPAMHTSSIVRESLSTLFNTDQEFLLISGGVTSKTNSQGTIDKIYVSMFGINNKLKTIFKYQKAHLVPFGEYIPSWIAKFTNISKLTHGDLSYAKGQAKNILLEDLSLKFTPLICYEIIFPTEVVDRILDADFIINIANDAWYGNSTEPYQHFVMSTFRAIENAVPVLRVSNNGISGVIDSIGNVIMKTKLNDITYIDNKIPKSLGNKTIFALYGEKSIIFLVCTLFSLEFLVRKLI